MRRIITVVLMIAIYGACSSAPETAQEDSLDCSAHQKDAMDAIECARGQAESWIEFTDYERDSPRGGLAVYSFADGPEHLQERTFLYDQALAILWVTWGGDYHTARALAKTLISLQSDDGSWGFSFEAREGGFYDEGYVRTGAMAWAGWAMAYYADRSGDKEALAAARKARSYIDNLQRDARAEGGGLYAAGEGYHDPDSGERVLGQPVEFVSTEHQFDVHKFLRTFDGQAAFRLQERILDILWLSQEGRFAMGFQEAGVDTRRALDTSGGWGALWLWSVGRQDLAARSLDFTLDTFGFEGVPGGFVPYLDEVDGYEPDAGLIFVEGSLGVALAALRLEQAGVTEEILAMAAALARRAGPGIPYADQSRGDFADRPAAASTLWFLMVEREWRTGERAPLFLP